MESETDRLRIQTEDVKRRVSGREEGEREKVVCVLGGAEEGGGRPGTPSN